MKKKSLKSQDRILEIALNLFHKQGVNATSIDEILAESATGKGQFYHYFKNKNDLILRVVQDFHKKLVNQETPIKYTIKNWNDLEEWFEMLINLQEDNHCQRGCPMATIAYELTPEQEDIRENIHLIFEYSKQPLIHFFSHLKEIGTFKTHVNPERLADLCYTTVHGGLLNSKVSKNTTVFRNSTLELLQYLKSLQK